MKTKILFVCFLILFGLETTVHAESYQRWIYWTNQPGHTMTKSELVDIVTALEEGKVTANKEYKLSTGITFRIPEPGLYKECIFRCVKASDKHIETFKDVINAIQLGEVVKWGNDISARVKNYYYSTVHKAVKYINNYSGAEFGIPVLLINGIPTMKMECGNPLEIIIETTPPTPTPLPPSPLVYSAPCPQAVPRRDTVVIVVQVQQQQSYQQGNWQRTGVGFIPDRNEDYSQPAYWYNGGGYNQQSYGMITYGGGYYTQPVSYQRPVCYQPAPQYHQHNTSRLPRTNPPSRVTNGGHSADGRSTNGGHP